MSKSIKVCWICLESNCDKIWQIEKNSKWSELFDYCVGEPVYWSDTPTYFCGNCAEKLENFEKFKTFCIKSNSRWRTLTKKPDNETAECKPKLEFQCDEKNSNISENFLDDFNIEVENCESTKDDSNDTVLDDMPDSDKLQDNVLLKVEKIKPEELYPGLTEELIEEALRINSFLCNKCGRSYSCESTLKAHITSFHKNKLKQKRIERMLDEIKPRKQKNSSPKPPTEQISYCGICDFNSNDFNEVNEHFKGHFADNFDCRLCSYSGRDLADMVHHRYEHHPQGYNFKFICPVCLKCVRTQLKLQFHYRSVHLGGSGGWCFACDKKMTSYKSFKVHLKAHAASECYICDHCGLEYPTRDKIVTHLRIHYKKYICDACGMTFSKICDLKSHVYYKHTKHTKVQCTHCNRYFLDGITYKKHLSSIKKEKLYVCEICSKSYLTLSLLKSHAISHSDDRPYSCDKCNKKFKRPVTLASHLRIHKGDRSHSCLHCEKAFYSKNELKRHLSVHTGIRPVNCSFCNKTFYNKAQKMMHCKSKHKLESFDIEVENK